jgi:hypothetical protein
MFNPGVSCATRVWSNAHREPLAAPGTRDTIRLAIPPRAEGCHGGSRGCDTGSGGETRTPDQALNSWSEEIFGGFRRTTADAKALVSGQMAAAVRGCSHRPRDARGIFAGSAACKTRSPPRAHGGPPRNRSLPGEALQDDPPGVALVAAPPPSGRRAAGLRDGQEVAVGSVRCLATTDRHVVPVVEPRVTGDVVSEGIQREIPGFERERQACRLRRRLW